MADDQFQATANWWDSSSSRTTAPSQHSSSSFPNFTWNLDHHDLKPTSSISDSPTSTHPNSHMVMPPWNNNTNTQPPHHHLNLLEEKGVSDGRFRTMFQENNFHSHNNNQHQVEWREKLLFSTESSSTSGDSIVTTSQGLANSSNFHMDSNNSYSAPPNPSILLQGLLAPEASSSSSSFDNNHNRSSCFNNFPYASALSSNNSDQLMASQFLRASPPKQTPHHGGGGGNRQLQFTNNTTFWNASEAHHHQHHAAIKEARPSCFFPNSLQPPFHSPNFDAQSKNICGGRETSSVGKKSGGETAPKRARNETSSTLPPFKVRKEKMGDRITALQQLVSPFGKTDTASVLSEAIEYIKFLHEQVSVLSTPYMKSGAPLQHQQSSGKCKESEALKQDLRSRGLCLVPVSSTFPVTHETTVDFWMPTFGATFR